MNDTRDPAGPATPPTTPPVLPPLTDPQGRTDVANARRLARRFGRDLRHVAEWRKFLVWSGTHWEVDHAGRAVQMAKEITDEIWREARESGNHDALQWAASSANLGHVNAMVKLAGDEVPVLVRDLDPDPWLLACPNGTVDLRTGELRPADRSDLLTSLCPTEFHAAAGSDRWERFVDEVFVGRADLVGWVRRFLGSALSGVVRDHVVAVFWGGGANGKSTLLEAVLATMGADLAFKAPSELLLARAGNAHPTEKAALFGKRLVVCTETGEGRRFDETIVKELTGGDTVTARRMREDFWSFRPTHSIVLCTNHRPRVIGSDNGIWRRLRMVPFDRTFAEHEQDTRLPERLRADASAVLSWMVRGCLEWQAEGLGGCEPIAAATASYRAEQDVIGRFVAEACVVDAAAKVKANEFRDALTRWCGEEGEKPPGPKQLGQYMTGRFDRRTSNGTWYVGVGLSA